MCFEPTAFGSQTYFRSLKPGEDPNKIGQCVPQGALLMQNQYRNPG